MQIIDAHHHLWCPVNDTANINYVWLKNIGAMKPFGDPTPIQRDYLAAEFCRESTQHEIIGSVHVQADGAIPDPVREAEWVESLHAEYALPSVHIGFLDLSADDATETLERYLKLSGFRGVRQILSRIDDRSDISFVAEHYLENPRWREQYALLAQHKLSFDLQLYPQQMQAAADFLALHPDIPVVIDHAGSPYDQTEAGLKRWREGLTALAALEHCSMKLSGFGMFDTQWDASRIQGMFEVMLELFGVDRLLFGSNFPVDKLMRNYDFGVEQIIHCAKACGLNEDEQDQIFRRNAATFYHL